MSDGETFATVKGSSFGEHVSRFCEYVMGGDHPPCILTALARKEMVLCLDRSRECGDCFFKSAWRGKEAAIMRVQHTDRPFGLLVILFALDAVADGEEKELLKEVAGDIALALHNMGLEEARKKAEDQIKASPKEKEVLLLEVHHRVRNNLQVVSSLLNMQARAAKNKDAIDILAESRDRIMTMALIHNQLYESGNLSEINIKQFIEKLLRQMFQNYPVPDVKITPIVHIDDYPLPIAIAIRLGLIVNELLTNAFKHAFVNRKEGKIEVRLSVSEESVVSLTVSDDGIGLPEGFNNKGTTVKIEFEIAKE